MLHVLHEVLYLLKSVIKTVLFVYLPVVFLMAAAHFPYDTGSPASSVSSVGFYDVAYYPKGQERGMDYEAVARAMAESSGIEAEVREFAAKHNLARKKVLEVGSGRGYLQDVVGDYTGLDLSPAVARYYHKPFVQGSATSMPFRDATFDAVWSVWVLEHIPEPERALREMRRVLKKDGLLFLHVAWNCTSWAADGLDVRPYSDLNWPGKFVKASIPLRSSPWFRTAHVFPVRALRRAQYALGGRREHLRFRALSPNYDTYWQQDSDAAISLDSFEAYLWFRSRGDECLNCGSPDDELWEMRNPLVIRVRK